jgi:predicted outer membrane repeat protein
VQVANVPGASGGVFYVASAALFVLKNSRFEGSAGSNFLNGGVLYITNCSNVTVSASIFKSQTVAGNGGAIFVDGDCTLHVLGGQFENCVAGSYRGAIAFNTDKQFVGFDILLFLLLFFSLFFLLLVFCFSLCFNIFCFLCLYYFRFFLSIYLFFFFSVWN